MLFFQVIGVVIYVGALLLLLGGLRALLGSQGGKKKTEPAVAVGMILAAGALVAVNVFLVGFPRF